jgi:hypothetical protein
MLAWLWRDHDIYCSDFGREYGWFVECQGKRVAELVDAVWDVDSQFWHDYRMVPLTKDPQELAELNSHDFWYRGGLIYENRKYGIRVTHVLAGLLPDEDDGKTVVHIRGLYLPVRFPLLWEMVCHVLPRCRQRYTKRMEASARLHEAKSASRHDNRA